MASRRSEAATLVAREALDGEFRQASPHVAGVAAVRRGVRPGDSPEQVRSWLVENSTAGVIGGNPAGTPNKLLYKAPSL